MANTIIGRILVIGQTEEIPSKNGGTPFQKRSLVLDCSRYDQFTGQKFENYPMLEFAGKHVSLLDGFKVDDIVNVSFALQGRSYTKDGVTKYFTSIVGYKVEPLTPITNYQDVPQTPQNAPAPQNVPVPQAPPSGGADDLPF